MYRFEGVSSKTPVIQEANFMPEKTENRILPVPVRDIRIGEANVRGHDAAKGLDELAASIKQYGLLQPVLLRGVYGNPPYELIVGQRRFLAHRDILKEKTIPARFDARISDTQAMILSLAENMFRVDLNHADAMTAVTKLYEHFGKNARRVSKATGLSLQRVNRYLDVEARASQKMKDWLRDKEVKPIDVQRALRAAQEDLSKAEGLLERMIREGMDGYEKEQLAEYGQEHPDATVDEIIDAAREPRITRRLSLRLHGPMAEGLKRAADTFAMDVEEIASRAITEWLSDKGFLPQES